MRATFDAHFMHKACTQRVLQDRCSLGIGRLTAMHLAQLNVGRLVAETDDPRVAEFMAALDRVNGLGKRMPGFVWMMEGSGEPGTGNTETKIGGDPRFVVEPDGLGERRGAGALRLEHRAPAVLRAAARVVRGAGGAAFGDVVGAGGAPADARRGAGAARRTCRRTATASTPSAGRLKEARLWRVKNCSAVAAE